jgi:hypothetical protein
MVSHQFLEEFQCGNPIALLGDIAFQNFAFVIDCSPKVVRLAVYLHEDLVQMPFPLA